MRDKILRFIDTYIPELTSISKDYNKYVKSREIKIILAEQITTHIMEFITFVNDNFYYDKAFGGYVPITIAYQGFPTKNAEELYQYWLNNIYHITK
jgi:hypothetical protein